MTTDDLSHLDAHIREMALGAGATLDAKKPDFVLDTLTSGAAAGRSC